MPIIGLRDLPFYSSTEGNLETVRFRYLFDQGINGSYYILELKDLITDILYMVMISEGNVFTKLENERSTGNRKKFNIKKILIPENEGVVISINDNHNFISLQ